MGGNLHRRMDPAAGCPADEQGNATLTEVRVFLHFTSHVLHLFQTGRNQAAQAHDIGIHFLGLGQDVVAGHHHAHVHHIEVVALEHHSHDVLADVVHIALDGGNHDLAFALHVATRGFELALFFLDVGHQVGDGLLHHAGTFDYLRQEHLALAKQVAHHVHAIHQRAFDHMERTATIALEGLPHLFSVFSDEFVDAVHQRVRQAFTHGQRTPGVFGRVVFGSAFDGFGDIQQALGRV